MLINIWATIIHLSDSYFSLSLKREKPSLDLLISERLQLKTNKQTWMVNPFWRAPATTEVLLRESYQTIRDSQESYLILFTPGFADIIKDVPLQLVESYLNQVHKRARVFNKRVIATSLGIPPESPPEVSKKIEELNKIIERVAKDHQGFTVNLRSISYEPWTNKGSRPSNLDEAAEHIVQAILNCHSSIDIWKKLHGR